MESLQARLECVVSRTNSASSLLDCLRTCLTFPLSESPGHVTFADFSKAMAFAIIKTGGRQHRVAEGDIIDVDFLDSEIGKESLFADVLFHGDGENLTHGTPLIEGATVTGEVMEQRKDKKVIAFKYRRRKGYHRTVGHRRKLTRIKITGISLSTKSEAKTK
jgi:large subunit ribosomal protein L21